MENIRTIFTIGATLMFILLFVIWKRKTPKDIAFELLFLIMSVAGFVILTNQFLL